MKGNIENSQYVIIHQWLADNFGVAKKCENKLFNILNFKCRNKSVKFQWAKKKNKKYSKNRNNFFQLCISCHSLYDLSDKIDCG